MADQPPRFRPKTYPAPEFPPRRLPVFARMPPVVFSVILGLLGLGLALRRGLAALGLPGGIAEAALGMIALLWLFAAVGYGVKLARRAGVLAEDLRVLPGRAGLAAATMGMMALGAVLVPYSVGLARGAVVLGLGLHAVLALLHLQAMRAGPPEARDVTPAWHLSFTGFLIAGLAARAMGWPELAVGLVFGAGAAAAVVWGLSAVQLLRRIPPAPLRPMLAIHLAPASLLGLVALGLDWHGVAVAFALFGAALLTAMVIAGRWITASGFSPLWGAFTFPLAAFASLLIGLGGGWLTAGILVLIAALGIIPAIAAPVLQGWMTGTLAQKSNAATA